MSVIDIEKIKRKHQRFMAEQSRAVDEQLNSLQLTQWVWRWVSDHGGFTSRTGNLVKRSKVSIIRTAKGRLVKTSNSAKYAAAQDLGSGLYGPKRAKYPIRAKGDGMLRFQGRNGIVFRKQVMHPGVHPTRFLYNANDALFRTTKQWLRVAMARAAAKF